MTTPNPAQVVADRALESAIEGVMAAYEMWPGLVLTEYVVIAVLTPMDSPRDPKYQLMFRDGAMPIHAAIGMVEVAKAIMLDGGFEDNDE